MPYPRRAYVVYVDDSGDETLGPLWCALAFPVEFWSEYLKRWLSFRKTLFGRHQVPANFELHAQAWISAKPEQHTEEEQLELVRNDDGTLPTILQRGADHRRKRFDVFEQGLKTIGGFTEAGVLTVRSDDKFGKLALYTDLLCFLEEFLEQERGHATLIVDGGQDGGGHLRTAHRGLLINRRSVLEDPTLRRSFDSQFLQMADFCAFAAFQSILDKATVDERFRRQYETRLSRLIQRPFGIDEGRCVRGWDYALDTTGCPSELATQPKA